MDLAREGAGTFVFGPLNRSEAYLSGFTGDCKDPDARWSGDEAPPSSWQRRGEDVLTLDTAAASFSRLLGNVFPRPTHGPKQ